MDQPTLEAEIKTLLSPTIWKNASTLKREVEERATNVEISLDRIYTILERFKGQCFVTEREGSTGLLEWLRTGNTSGLPVEEIPVNPKALVGGDAVPLPAW